MFWRTLFVTVFAFATFTETLGKVVTKKDLIKIRYQPMCEQSGNLDKLDDLVSSVEDSSKCLEDTVNIETFQDEFRRALLSGGLKEVFKRQCVKSSQLKTCAHTMLRGLSLCMDSNMRAQMNESSVDEVIDFVCYNDGERIIKFIIEDGPQCFEQKLKTIGECMDHVQRDAVALFKLNQAEQCAVLENVSSCVIKELKTCPTQAAADLITSLVDMTKKSSQCK